MSAISFIRPSMLAVPRSRESLVGRLARSIVKLLPTLTTTRNSYRRQAGIFRLIARKQNDRVLAAAYHDAAKVLEDLAAE